MRCPGSINLAKDIVDPGNKYARAGSTAHELLEKSLLQRVPPGQVNDPPDGVDSEMLAGVLTAWKLIAGFQSGSESFEVEKRVNPGAIYHRDDLWGTADALIIHRKANGNGHLTCIDFKYGKWPIDPATNVADQLRIYAIGGSAESPLHIEDFTIGIIQPRSSAGGPPLRLHNVTREAMEAFAAKLGQAAVATDDPAAQRIPGDHCKFCRARSTCRDYGKKK
jgi:hypothetical protein